MLSPLTFSVALARKEKFRFCLTRLWGSSIIVNTRGACGNNNKIFVTTTSFATYSTPGGFKRESQILPALQWQVPGCRYLTVPETRRFEEQLPLLRLGILQRRFSYKSLGVITARILIVGVYIEVHYRLRFANDPGSWAEGFRCCVWERLKCTAVLCAEHCIPIDYGLTGRDG